MKYFVYFSASGNGDFIAKEMEEKGYQPLKVEMVKPFGKVGFFKILKYGFQATRKKKAKIKELNLELKEDSIKINYIMSLDNDKTEFLYKIDWRTYDK